MKSFCHTALRCFQLHTLAILALTTLATATNADEYPSATIKNDAITAKLYLPDAKKGYYRGTRFDWSGVIHSLTFDGHEYFGEWQDSDDPYLHDHITGPVDSFEVDTEIKPGETFFRIGVGVCGKPKPSDGWKHPARVLNPGKWHVEHGDNWIEMVHKVTDDKTGKAYRYTKRLTLTLNKPELVIDHFLTNTGTQPLESEVYNHNFFVIDGQPTGPDFVLRFPFNVGADRDLKANCTVGGKELTYSAAVPQGKQAFGMLTGFSSDENDHRFDLFQRKSKAGVRMVTDRPMDKLRFWSPSTTICPEPFINLNIQTNQSERWSIRYTFYTQK